MEKCQETHYYTSKLQKMTEIWKSSSYHIINTLIMMMSRKVNAAVEKYNRQDKLSSAAVIAI